MIVRVRKKRFILFCACLGICVSSVACQKTPEESAIVNKSDGLNQSAIAQKLQAGEERKTDIPQHWKVNEKKSNDRVLISADLKLETMSLGNLPVIEVKNHKLTKSELSKLVTYFTGEEELYVSQNPTKEFYQEVLARIENGEGAYGDSIMLTSVGSFKEDLKNIIEQAPDQASVEKKTTIDFGKETKDLAYKSFEKLGGISSEETEKQYDIYFSADVGEEREASIQAETYQSELHNYSKFSWEKGSEVIALNFVQSTISTNDFAQQNQVGDTEYIKKFSKILNAFRNQIESISIDETKELHTAEKVIGDLKIQDMTLSSSQKALWFPKGMCPDMNEVLLSDDIFWQAELENAEVGYQFVFSKEIEGVKIQKSKTSYVEQQNLYSPPFPVETITIMVTESGVKGFSWNGMSEEEKQIAENTNLLAFDKIQQQLVDQIMYKYSAKGQPANDTTTFQYDIIEAKLIYTYITAYTNPENAWLVPAWFFVVDGKERELQNWYFTINALDGGVITG